MKRIALATAYLTVTSLLAWGQTSANLTSDDLSSTHHSEPADAFAPLNNDASFPGGHLALQDYLQSIDLYPYQARQAQVEGTVKVRFRVQPNGYLIDVRVTQSHGQLLDQAALQTIEQMPRWYPAHRNGMSVAQAIELPITFRLD
ncbi:energy transducer TonB [Spirosoma montaniterrae]|uniref:TonB C-terminal domain-containing protein n=1 Tax=Spirosoma montaniterrae TaxID=1178516 RepID=A0A1P9WZV5_9BACT|nr:energy transducer TonB [Spirosoma montaniterrae]AQG80878.1 hypothetical protein AWR27_17060 [Spirosoma montaniterrae]